MKKYDADSDEEAEVVEVEEVDEGVGVGEARILSSKSRRPVHIVHVAPSTKRGSEFMDSLQPVGAS